MGCVLGDSSNFFDDGCSVRIHCPFKLNNLVEKGKCIAVLEQGLDDLAKGSNEFLRASQVSSGMGGHGISRAIGERCTPLAKVAFHLATEAIFESLPPGL